MKKCTFCVDRVRKGVAPACVDTCPAHALKFSAFPEIVSHAKNAKDDGYPVYGLDREWATSWVYVFPKGVDLQMIEKQLRTATGSVEEKLRKAV